MYTDINYSILYASLDFAKYAMIRSFYHRDSPA